MTIAPISKVQEHNLGLIASASFNDFDGNRVVKDLIDRRDLWNAAMMTRGDLIPLRDLPKGQWNVDTLYITPVAGKEDELYSLAQDWYADSVDWIGGEKACKQLGYWSSEGRANPKQILSVWWD